MKSFLIAATALTLLSAGAYAQSYSDSGSNATATNSSASRSSSVSNPRVNVIGNPIGNGASSSYSNAGASANTRSSSSSAAVGNRSSLRNTTNILVSSSGSGGGASGSGTTSQDPAAGGDPTIRYEGGYTVRNTPEVIPPTVMGGNTCAVGASAGVALPGFGIAGGATWADKACERRQQAALLYNMGEPQVAFALMCQDDHIRGAMKEAGHPCLQDRPVAMAPPVREAPAKVAAVLPTPQPKPAWCTPATVSPAHLSTLSEGQRVYVRLNCGA